MTKKEWRVIYSETERIDPLWYVLIFFVVVEAIAILLVLLLAYLSGSMSNLHLIALGILTNLFHTVIGIVGTALMFRSKERQAEPQRQKGPVVFNTTEIEGQLPPYDPSQYQLPTNDPPKDQIEVKPKLQLPTSVEDSES